MVPTHVVCDALEDETFDGDVYPEHAILRPGWLYTAVVEACGHNLFLVAEKESYFCVETLAQTSGVVSR